MIFNTISEMKLFLQDYAVYHHRPYTVTHSDQELRYHVIYKNGCMWRLNARKRQSDGKWRISKVVQPHTCLSNKGKKNHHQLTARYLARRILGLVDNNNDISVSSLQEPISSLSMMWSTERLGVISKLPWRFVGVARRKHTTGFSEYCVQCITTTLS
jgi:hypothetical protein